MRYYSGIPCLPRCTRTWRQSEPSPCKRTGAVWDQTWCSMRYDSSCRVSVVVFLRESWQFAPVVLTSSSDSHGDAASAAAKCRPPPFANASLLLGTQSREGRTVLCGRPRRAGCELRPSPLAEPEGPVSWLLPAPRKAAAVSNFNCRKRSSAESCDLMFVSKRPQVRESCD